MKANHLARESVGWCHGCGTLQLKSEMPTDFVEWAEDMLPVCLDCGAEPWSSGVWDKGAHATSCSWYAAARQREVDWSPAFACTCHDSELD